MLRDLTRDGARSEERAGDAAAARVRHPDLRRAERSLALLRDAKVSVGLDRPALGRRGPRQPCVPLDKVVAAARSSRVRIFTVGLRSGAFDAAAAARDRRSDRRVVRRSPFGGGARSRSTRSSASSSPASTSSATGRLRGRCRRWTSASAIDGSGTARTAYVAPTPSLLAPYHRSLVSRVPALRRLAGAASACSSGCSCARCCSCSPGARRRQSSTASESFSQRARPAASQADSGLDRAAGRRSRNRYATRLVGRARARPGAGEDERDAAAGGRGWHSVARFSSSRSR